MPLLQWSDDMALGDPAMDATHHEFIDLLASVVQASDAELLARWQALIGHTEAHFAREDRWMQATGFAAGNCHSAHHAAVLAAMRAGERDGDPALLRRLADELGVWFPHHADAMDAALAQHLRAVGYDTETGVIAHPQALPQEAIQGCSSDECTPPKAPSQSSTDA